MKRSVLGILLLFVVAGTAIETRAETAVVDSRSVELYTTSWCPYCRKAEAFFENIGMTYISYDVEKDKLAAKRKQQLDSRMGVPLVVINGQAIYGYSERLYRAALDADN